MTDLPTVRTLAADEWRTYKNLRLAALADSPDAFSSTLAEEAGWLDADWARRFAASIDSREDLPLVAEIRGEPIGLAWGRIEPSCPDVAALYHMWVAPGHRGMGAGHMLLAAVIAWATARNASFLNLDVTCGDRPARRLYERAGFKAVGHPEPLRPGSELLVQSMRLALRDAVEHGHGRGPGKRGSDP